MHLCLRGSQVGWRLGTGIDDGACLPAVIPVYLYVIYVVTIVIEIKLLFTSDDLFYLL